MTSYMDTAPYMRARQKIGRLQPDQRAILNNVLAANDAAWASEDERNLLRSLTAAADREYRGDKLDLSKKRLAQKNDQFYAGLGLRRDAFESGQNDALLGDLVSGAGVLAQGHLGSRMADVELARAKEIQNLRRRLYGLGG